MSTIQEIFDLDPLQLTQENIDALIEHYRKARAQFQLGDKSAGATKKIGKPPLVDLDLDDLLGAKS